MPYEVQDDYKDPYINDNPVEGLPADTTDGYNVEKGGEFPPEGVIREEELVARNPVFRAFRKVFNSGVEVRGIERVPEDERDGKHTIGLLLLWWSVNMVVSTVPIGVSSFLTPVQQSVNQANDIMTL